SAHPLGNFTVNHYDGLRLGLDRVENFAVVDTAEIPTLQERTEVDADHNGTVSEAERGTHAVRRCAALAAGLDARLGEQPLSWRVTGSGFAYRAGAAGLQVSRLECHLTAAAQLTAESRLSFRDGYLGDR